MSVTIGHHNLHRAPRSPKPAAVTAELDEPGGGAAETFERLGQPASPVLMAISCFFPTSVTTCGGHGITWGAAEFQSHNGPVLGEQQHGHSFGSVRRATRNHGAAGAHRRRLRTTPGDDRPEGGHGGVEYGHRCGAVGQEIRMVSSIARVSCSLTKRAETPSDPPGFVVDERIAKVSVPVLMSPGSISGRR